MFHVNQSGLHDLSHSNKCHMTSSLVATQWLQDKQTILMMYYNVGHDEIMCKFHVIILMDRGGHSNGIAWVKCEIVALGNSLCFILSIKLYKGYQSIVEL